MAVLDVLAHLCVFQLLLLHSPKYKIQQDVRQPLIIGIVGVQTQEHRAEYLRYKRSCMKMLKTN